MKVTTSGSLTPRVRDALLRPALDRSWRDRRLVRRMVDTERWTPGLRHTKPGLTVRRYSPERLIDTQAAVVQDEVLCSRLHAGLVRDLVGARNEADLVLLVSRVKWWEDQDAEERLVVAACSVAGL